MHLESSHGRVCRPVELRLAKIINNRTAVKTPKTSLFCDPVSLVRDQFCNTPFARLDFTAAIASTKKMFRFITPYTDISHFFPNPPTSYFLLLRALPLPTAN